MGPKKKRLCIILPHHWSFFMGGCQYQIKCLLDANVLQKKYEIFILSRRADQNITPRNYTLINIVKPFALQRYGFIFDASFLWQKLKEIAPDVIYQNMGTSYAGVAAHYARQYGCKFVLHLASDSDITPFKMGKNLKRLFPYIEKKVFGYAVRHNHCLIAQTRYQKHLVKKNFDQTCTAIISNFQPYPKETIQKGNPVKVVWIANFKVIKQPELFIRLAHDLHTMEIAAEFIMIGNPATIDGNAWQNWQQSLEREMDKVPALSYIGGQSPDAVEAILAKSDILVNTSQFEGFSNTFIQAWMRCVPVVSLHSNPDNLLSDGRIGLISNNYNQLCKDVIRLIKDAELRTQMGAQAREYALKHFTMDNATRVAQLL